MEQNVKQAYAKPVIVELSADLTQVGKPVSAMSEQSAMDMGPS